MRAIHLNYLSFLHFTCFSSLITSDSSTHIRWPRIKTTCNCLHIPFFLSLYSCSWGFLAFLTLSPREYLLIFNTQMKCFLYNGSKDFFFYSYNFLKIHWYISSIRLQVFPRKWPCFIHLCIYNIFYNFLHWGGIQKVFIR